jgi:hypothetical protein
VLVPHRFGKRKLLIAGLVLLAAAGAVYLTRESPVGLSAYRRIRVGVAVTEAAPDFPSVPYVGTSERVFVVKESEGSVSLGTDGLIEREAGPGIYEMAEKDTGELVVTIRVWIDGNRMISAYERDGRIVAKSYAESMPGYELWFRRLLQRLGL